MRRLLTYSDGRLKTGRVAIMVFILLIGSLGILFNLGRPVDHVLVAVRHHFEPENKPADNKIPDSRPREDAVKQPVKAKAHSQKDVKPPAPASPAPEKTNEKPKLRLPATTGTKSITGIKDESSETIESQENKAEPKQNNAETLVEAAPGKFSPLLKPENQEQSKPPVKAESSQGGSGRPEQTQPIEENQSREKPEIDIAGKLKELYHPKKEIQASKEKQQDMSLALKDKDIPALAEQKDGKPFNEKQSAGPLGSKTDFGPHHQSITVSSKQYRALFKSWRTAGKNPKENEKIPLRVENLKHAFSLFQMKAVAVIGNRRFFDLSDGSRIPESSLAEFSTTVFRVKQPWEKWGEELAANGIRQSETIEVRYYMYDFIKKAIYERAEQAFAYCQQEGLIDMDTPPSGVDILGRAFVIKKHGGGQFAVFVPIAIDTESGRTVNIDPAYFRDRADVQALIKAGLL